MFWQAEQIPPRCLPRKLLLLKLIICRQTLSDICNHISLLQTISQIKTVPKFSYFSFIEQILLQNIQNKIHAIRISTFRCIKYFPFCEPEKGSKFSANSTEFWQKEPWIFAKKLPKLAAYISNCDISSMKMYRIQCME